MTNNNSIRREHIRVGYLDNGGHPFDVSTDEEADEAIRRDLRATNPNWRPVAMYTQQLCLYRPAHTKLLRSRESLCEERAPPCKQRREERRPSRKRERERET